MSRSGEMDPASDPKDACPKCEGFGDRCIKSGASGGTTMRVCRHCKGSGVDPESELAKQKEPSVVILTSGGTTMRVCRHCNGSG